MLLFLVPGGLGLAEDLGTQVPVLSAKVLSIAIVDILLGEVQHHFLIGRLAK